MSRVRSRTVRLAATMAVALVASLCVAVAVAPRLVHADPPVSPLLWGENLVLDKNTGTGDWFLGSAALRSALKTAHTQIIRMPVRGPDPDTAGWANEPEFKAAIGYVKQLGMAPLVILRNPEAPQALDTDLLVVDYVQQLFGTQPVYYEFGNETDLDDGTGNLVTAASYVAHWNQTVPTLKAHAGTAAKFLGPVSYQYDESYLRTFLASAQPRPDAVSWHMYTCSTTEPEDACLNAGGIDDWPARFTQARAAMRATLNGAELPIWITEWNFNPASDLGADPKRNDQAFLRAWTLKALKTFADSGVVASMHYNVEGLVPLATSSGTLAAEGQAFKDQYEALVGAPPTSPSPSASLSPSPSASPSPSPSTSPSPTPSGPPTGSGVVYSFEDGGLGGWSKTGSISSLSASTDVGGQQGSYALKATLTTSGPSDLPYVHVNPATGPTAGQTYSAYVYVPASTTTTVTAKLYVQDSAFHWHSGDDVVLGPRGSWIRLAFTPSGYTGAAKQIGVQFGASPAGATTTVYVDAVTWG